MDRSVGPGFLDALIVSPMQDGYTWFLTKEFRYCRGGSSGNNSTIISVPAGFETDFASVPSPFWMIFPKWGTYGEAAVLHDWLYWNHEVALSKQQADDVFREAMVASGVAPWKVRLLHLAVSWFGQAAWNENRRLRERGYTRINDGLAPQPGRPRWRRKTLIPRRSLAA